MTQQELIDKINEAANIIANSSRYSNSNYIIVSPKIAETIENLDIRKLRKKKLLEIEKKPLNRGFFILKMILSYLYIT